MSNPTKTITWDNLNSSTIGEFDRTLKDGIFNKHLLLKKLNDNKKNYSGGVYITEPVMKAMGNGGSYSGMDVLTPQDKEIVTTAVWAPAHYESDITISYTDDLANRGPAQIFDLLEAKYQNARKTMEFNMTAALFGDGVRATYGNAPIVGLKAAVAEDPTTDPSSGAYGGITRDATTDSDFWKNQIKDEISGGLTGLTMLKLQNLWGLCSDGNEHPDIIVTTQDVYDKIWSLADAKQQLGNEEAARLGYQSIDFNGVPLIVDKNCPDGYLYMLNTEYIYLKVHQDDDMAATPFLQGTTQLVKVKYITWTGQLVCGNPRYQGVMFGLT